MAASRVKELLDELASVLAEMGALEDSAEESVETAMEGDEKPSEEGERSVVAKVEARQAQYDALVAKAERIKAAIAKEEAREAKKAELLKVLHRAAPVETTDMAKPRIEPVSYRGYKPGVFESPESAHRSGMWLKAHFGDSEARRWCRDNVPELRDMGGQVNTLGGALVFEEFSSTIIRLVEQYGVAMNLAQKVSMSSDTLLVPKRLTGVTGYWIGENTTITTSDPTVSMVQLVAKKLAMATRVSNELLADNAISVAQWLAQEYALTYAYTVDDAFFNGDGTLGLYGGIRGLAQITDGTHTASVSTAASGNTTLATLDIDDFTRALGTLPRYAIGTSAWYMHPQVYHTVVQRMMLSTGTVSTGVIGALAGGNTAANLSQSTPTTFLGLPVVWVLRMNATPTTNQIYAYVGDLSLSSIMASKSDLQIASSTDRYFEVDQTAFRAVARLDINHHSLGTNSEAGPVVGLRLA